VATSPKVAARQLDRRQRVLRTALAMAAEGGYEAVQMRDLAERAQVALTTLYRDFGSKDHLLAAAWAQWTEGIEDRLLRRPLRGTTMAERATDFFSRTTRALAREPRLAVAVLLAANSADPGARAAQDQASRVLSAAQRSAFAELDDELAQAIVRILNHVWNSALQQWVSGRVPIGHVHDVLDKACRLLLDPHDPAATDADPAAATASPGSP
jgi:AcrR family transcriptional regulator